MESEYSYDPEMQECVCGHVLDEHTDEGSFSRCEVEDCGCIDFEASEP